MNYKIEEIDITNNFEKIGLEIPKELTFLPENFEISETKDDFIFSDKLSDIRKILKSKQIAFKTLGNEKSLQRVRKSTDIYLPAFFISYSLLTDNSNVISVLLNLLSNYIYDLIKVDNNKSNVNIEFYVEKTKSKTIKKITYKGNIEGIHNLEKLIKSME